ncbi:hypothetical protein BA190_16815 [Labrys sp. WJW]|uniref:hypothetical protein n=1 Tax=Labrys sp. WJW TaxID=1737983 RepID=UPI00082FF981|nr:hypothetical protein [Labrys sp. WJW]OCC03747.1 hypothetical protein BA190_16815 [Labrys sp. WJW]
MIEWQQNRARQLVFRLFGRCPSMLRVQSETTEDTTFVMPGVIRASNGLALFLIRKGLGCRGKPGNDKGRAIRFDYLAPRPQRAITSTSPS